MNGSAFERHFQTGIQLLLIALLLWAGQQLVQTGTRVVSLEVKVTALEMAMTSNMDDRYRARDAARDFESIRREMAEKDRLHDAWHKGFDERLRKMEGKP
jgi:hypothetical protein